LNTRELARQARFIEAFLQGGLGRAVSVLGNCGVTRADGLDVVAVGVADERAVGVVRWLPN